MDTPSAEGLAARTLSVVTPVLNEHECVELFYRRTRAALDQCGVDGYEIIFVDDGSTDATPGVLHRLAQQDPAVKILTLSRNFGHHPAVFAGLEFARGDAVVLIDADLQDPPELIPALVAEHRRGHEIVFARRRGQADGWLLRWLKRGFRRLMRRISSIEFPNNIGVFSVMSRSVATLLQGMPERERYLVPMQMYLGFRVGFVEYEREQRAAGRSKQSLGRLFRLGMNSLFGYSSLPLRLSMVAWCVCLIATLAALGYTLYSRFVLRNAIIGWASVMTAVLGIGAVQLFSLWIICEYVDRIFENSKGRPYYVVWRQAGALGIPQASGPASPQRGKSDLGGREPREAACEPS